MLTANRILHDRYQIVRLIAQGGMGAVYEALDQRLQSRVAIKQTTMQGEALSKAFESEARLLANLRHTGLPRVIDHFIDENGQFLVMEYIPGDDLGIVLKETQGGFPVEQVVEWGDKLLDILEYLHSQTPPIIHRDIKPQNIKLSGPGEPILLDFGLAKGSAAFATALNEQQPSLYGYTPQYAPIEQMNSTGTDARSDLYSLAATLYHLIANQAPATTSQRTGEIAQGKPDPLIPINRLQPNVPLKLAATLQRALAIQPKDRFQSAASFREALATASRTYLPNGTDQEDRTELYVEDRPKKKRTWLWLAGGAIALLLVVCGFGAVAGMRLIGLAPGSFTEIGQEPIPVMEAPIVAAPMPYTPEPTLALEEPSPEPLPTYQADTPSEIFTLEDSWLIEDQFTQQAEEKVYAFEVKNDNQRIFTWVREVGNGMSQHKVFLLDEQGQKLQDSCFGCASLGRVLLPKAGVYRIVTKQDPAEPLGAYKIALNLVPPSDEFMLSDFEDISSKELEGAGLIRVSGAEQIYEFTAEPQEQIFISFPSKDVTVDQINVSLFDQQNNQLAHSCFGCGEASIGLQTLSLGGTYRIVVGDSREPGTGAYELRINRVDPPQEFDLELPIKIEPNQGDGAGLLRLPGEHQIYRFSAKAGQQIFVAATAQEDALSLVEVRLMDSYDQVLASTCFGCGEWQPVTINQDGEYRIEVGDPNEYGWGIYSLEVKLLER
jgi:hypothetical protein